ncbi:uncharacterized protein LOC125229445 [Leguminivora glycinivorella]|uniref:uncharacterized protein LOC125229445 n=1 Tax=Leguminivora glycinivorella TaxID=1035111 RepID=UPI002010BAFC|nr:uncharacterized protein LOC125229445 [Leguminivora glycinivorella]
MWVTFTLNGKKLVIGTAYRPPWMDLQLFLDAVSDSISSIRSYDNIVILGDFNVNLLNIPNTKVTQFNNFVLSFGLFQLVSDPTHFTDTSQTLIDVVCSDMQATNTTIDHVGSLYGHCLVVCNFCVKREKSKPCHITYRPLKEICDKVLDADMREVDWDSISNKGNINDIVTAFNQRVLNIFDTHAPIKTSLVKIKSYPWITDTVKLMMRLRDNAASDFHRNQSEVKKKYYKDLKTVVNKAIYFEKVAYFEQNINNKINDPKILWKNLKSNILPSKTNELPTHFNNPCTINKHFLDLPGTSGVTLSQLTYFEFHRFGDSVFSLNTINSNETMKIIRGLKSNAEGADGINLNMIILTLPYTINIITYLINLSIVSSTFPDIWKLAIVNPLPKVSNPSVIKDLRPISILPCLSKIIEKAVCAQLTTYLEMNNILPDVQSGFRKGRSTTTALLDVTDNILDAQDKGMCTVLVLLDFSRAFDCLNINLLLSKLTYYGFDQKTIRWFESYLSNRSQIVKVRLSNGSSLVSEKVELTRGVPQGSVIGPLLFILYSADIRSHILHCKYHIYADDIQVYISCKPAEINTAIEKLNQDLTRIATWASANCLLLNPSKTKYLVFGSKQRLASVGTTVDVMLMNEPVERVCEARNLGLLMDCELRFEKHTAEAVRSCFYKLKVLYKIRPYLSETLRIRLIESLVLSKLNYMDVVTGPRLLAKTKKLIQRVQNACARFCFNIPLRAHVTPFLNQHKILKMLHRRKLHLACLLFGVLKYKSPAYLYNKLSCIKLRDRRQCGIHLLTPRHASAAFRGSYKYQSSKCWNNIPPPLKNTWVTFPCRLHIKILSLPFYEPS